MRARGSAPAPARAAASRRGPRTPSRRAAAHPFPARAAHPFPERAAHPFPERAAHPFPERAAHRLPERVAAPSELAAPGRTAAFGGPAALDGARQCGLDRADDPTDAARLGDRARRRGTAPGARLADRAAPRSERSCSRTSDSEAPLVGEPPLGRPVNRPLIVGARLRRAWSTPRPPRPVAADREAPGNENETQPIAPPDGLAAERRRRPPSEEPTIPNSSREIDRRAERRRPCSAESQPHFPVGCSTNEKYALTRPITRIPMMISVRDPMM